MTKQKKMPPLEPLMFIIAVLLTCILAAWIASGCNVMPVKPYPAKDIDQVVGDCTDACARMQELKCDGWQGSPGQDEQHGTEDDVTCIETCALIEINPDALLRPDCIAKIQTCEDMDRCYD